MNVDESALSNHTDIEYHVEDIGLDEIREIEERSYNVIERLRETVFAPNKKKILKRTFSISEVGDLIGRTPTAIRDAEKTGRLPEPRKDVRGRRSGYTLSDINIMRSEFGTLPWRKDVTDEPVIIAIQNFKGGVGKSTITTHTAQYLALSGYRVCVIDCDPQGSTTSLFGVNPDYDLEEGDTLYPFLVSDKEDLSYAIHDTYWDQLKLIPSNLSLYNVEYQLAARVVSNPRILDRLRFGIDSIKDQYDVILIDPPPALGMISLSTLRAATALIVPTRPATIDFGSTAHFFTMLIDALEALKKHGMPAGFKFLKVLANCADEKKSAQVEITNMMKAVYGTQMLSTVMKDSAEIDNAGGRLMSVYELESHITSRETHQRCKAYLNGVNREIEILIRKTWPSNYKSLRAEGLI